MVSGTLDSWEYLASYGDLINAFGPNSALAANHYNTYGIAEGRTITFNAWTYLASYDDLMGAFGADPLAAAKHYVTWGYGEGRLTTFDAQAYLDNYGDLQAAFGSDLEAAAEHFVVFGRSEGRNDYTLDADMSSVSEGGTVTFTLDTHDLAEGTSFDYTITGLSAADIVGDSDPLSGTAVVDADGKAVVSVTAALDTIVGESGEQIVFSVAGHQEVVLVNNTTAYTLSVSPTTVSGGVDEGETAYFTLSTTGVPAGSSFAYTISGVTEADVVGGNLSGTETVGADGKVVIAVDLTEDMASEGTETLTLTIAGQSASVAVNDTSFPTYELNAETATVDEGGTAVFVLETTGVAAGSQFDYVISGVSAADVVGGKLTGTATVGNDGKAVVSIVLATDVLAETDETMTLSFNGIGVSDSILVLNTTGDWEGTYTLTSRTDIETANIFNAPQDYTPGGNDRVNTLQSEDELTGEGDNPTLNATLGDTNDASESMVSPYLTNVQTVNLKITGDDIEGMNFQDTDGVVNVNILRVTANNSDVVMEDLQDSTVSLSVSDATRDGRIEFNYAEGMLEGNDDTVALGLNNVRLDKLEITQGSEGWDEDEDEGYSVETLNVTVNGDTNIDKFMLAANEEEEESGVEQTLNIVANDDLEINHIRANGVETMNLTANADIVFAADEDDALDRDNSAFSGWFAGTNDLRNLNIDGDGDVTYDGLTSKRPDVDVDASAMTGDLRLGVAGSTAASSATDIVSGSGDDEIRTYGDLGGNVSTDGGDDLLVVEQNSCQFEVKSSGPSDVYGDFLPTATVDMGEGNDTVIGDEMLASGDNIANQGNSGEDYAATIDLGNGNNVATVAEMRTAISWNDWDTFDNDNTDDTYTFNINTTPDGYGASTFIAGGTGNDTVDLIMMEENAVITLDGGNDNVVFNSEDVDMMPTAVAVTNDSMQGGMAAVMWGDSQDARERVNIASQSAAQDILGAQVYLGTGDNSVTFNDLYLEEGSIQPVDSVAVQGGPCEDGCPDNFGKDILLMGEGALIQADGGTDEHDDELNVNFVNDVTVAARSDWGFYNAGMQKMIEGIDTINLTALQVENLTLPFGGTNDASIELDVLRVDGDLETINLVSEEDVNKTSIYVWDENHNPGNPVCFQLDNLRQEVDVNLTANEASGVDSNQHIKDDGDIFAVDATYTGSVPYGDPLDGIYGIDYYMFDEIKNDIDIVDVYLTVNNDDDNASSHEDTFVLNVTQGSGEFDLDLTINSTLTPYTSAGVDADNLIEDVTINFDDAGSHYVDMNGYGDEQHVKDATDTKLTVYSAAGASETITVVKTNAAEITFLGNSPIAANVNLVVDAENDYTITTGTGNDIIDMRDDNVNTDDIITADAGRDVLVVSGDDSLGQQDGATLPAGKNLAPYQATAEGTLVDDDVFEFVTGFEVITIDTDSGSQTGSGASGSAAPQRITLDEEAADFNDIDTINVIGSIDGSLDGSPKAHWLDLVIGDDYELPGDTLKVDARMNYTSNTIQIDNRDKDEVEQVVNLDVRVNAEDGTQLNFVDTGNEDFDVEVTVLTLRDDAQTNINNSAGVEEGNVRINVVEGSIDKVVLEDGDPEDANETGEGVVVTIADEWTEDNGEFTLDASQILNSDIPTSTGGAVISVDYGDTADLIIDGTQNDDTIFGGMNDDDIDGNNGDDLIDGDLIEAYTDTVDFEDVVFRTGDTLTVNYDGVSKQFIAADGDTTEDALDSLVSSLNSDGASTDWIAQRVGNSIVVTQTTPEHNAADSDFVSVIFTPAAPTVETITYQFTDLNWGENVNFDFTDAGSSYGYSVWSLILVDYDLEDVADDLATDVLNESWTVTGTNRSSMTFTGPSNGDSFEAPVISITGGDGGNVVISSFTEGENATTMTIGSPVEDVAVYGDGDDTIDGGYGNDTIYGHGGDDVINGDEDADRLFGNDGDDTITGGTGNDTITGGLGADDLNGNSGNDVFNYDAVVESSGISIDHIYEFEASADKFDFCDLVTEGGFDCVDFIGNFADDSLANTALVVTSDVLQVVFVEEDNKLYADMNGNGVIDGGDLAIEVDVIGSLTDSNFLCTTCPA
jgi:Ca2+-binding RTX toxin-like protein